MLGIDHALCRLRAAFTFRVQVYAKLGFRYKCSMSDVAMQSDASAPSPALVNSALGRRSVVLVGMMGAGKSSIGRRLAARLGLSFVDADAEIEKSANMSIAEIFE